MKRLTFLTLLFLAGCVDFAALEKSYAERKVVEKVGVLAHTDINWPKSTAPLKKALAFFAAEGVSKVIFLGDPTEKGYANQKEVFDLAWRTSFRGKKAPELVLAPDPYEWAGVSWTGTGRFPLTDLLCVRSLNGKTINAGSMRGITISDVFDQPDSRITGQWKTSAQGLLVLCLADGLIVRRMDFSGKNPQEVGPAWEVDAEGVVRSSEGKNPPEFWPDTRISVVKGYDKKGDVVYTVKWPPVLAKYTGERAFSYEVFAGKKILRRVQSAGFHRSESDDAEAVSVLISQSELIDIPEIDPTRPRFGVRPVSSLGRKGRTIFFE